MNNNINYENENSNSLVVTLDDIVEVYVYNKFGAVKPFIIKLSQEDSLNDSSYVSLTLDNPLAKAIVGKKVNDVTSYHIGDTNYIVKISKKFTEEEFVSSYQRKKKSY